LKNVESQGGKAKELLELRGRYRSSFCSKIYAKQSGYISHIDAWKTGYAAVQLGVGRNRTEDKVSPTAGVQFFAKRGAMVSSGDLLMMVWAADEAGLNAALPQLEEAVEYSDTIPAKRNLILKEVS
jgi:pyrimidine-nucleoside phosphorylase